MSALPRFDSRAKTALATAQQIAIQMSHGVIGSEHLLFGILSQSQDGLPFQIKFIDNISNAELIDILSQKGNLDKFQKMTDAEQATFKFGNNFLPEISKELQSCLDVAIRVAEDFNYDYIGLEHLIFGILDVIDSHGKKVIGVTDATSTRLSAILIDLFGNFGKNDATETPTTTLPQQPPKPKNMNPKSQSALNFFTINLNKQFEADKNFTLVDREKEIERIIQILSRKTKNNPIILGEPGVGKTALVEGLAKRITDGNVPTWLQGKQIMSLDVAGLLAGAMFRGEFEQRVKMIIDEAMALKNVILFIDELHSVIGAGSSSNGGPDLSGILKPALSRGELTVIGATTQDEYRTIIKKDKAFERRFQAVKVEQPSVIETISIIRGIKASYENFHNVVMPDELVADLVELSERFIPERNFPDKAVDLMDEAMARTRLINHESSDETNVKDEDWVYLERQILDLIKRKNQSILNQEKDLTTQLEKDQKFLEEALAALNVRSVAQQKSSIVTHDILEKSISSMSGVPLVRISSNVQTSINNLSESLSNQIFGQTEAIDQVVRAMKRSYAGVNPNKGPIASFLLLGPTGVGKTELVKLVTAEMYGDLSKYLLKIDMSEFAEKHQMSRLLGAPAGYIGHEEKPQLTDFLRQNPYSVILFDEIEKAHPQNLNILLQMLEDGKITDAKGNTVSCEHALIFLTSNLGKSKLNKFASKLGFVNMENKDDEDYNVIKKQVMDEVEKSIKPEILGRLTSKTVFRPITKSVLIQIINKELTLLQKHLLKQGRSINFKSEVAEKVCELAKDKIEYGAREVKSLIAESIQDKVAEYLLDNPKSNNVRVSVTNGEIVAENGNRKAVVKKTKVLGATI